MPIYHKSPPSIVGNHNTAEIDYHTSEAAKVKRTREQAYFNSYDFDAIEVLPYEDEEEDDEEDYGAEDDKGIQRGPIATTISNSQTKHMKISQQKQHRLSQIQHTQQQQHKLSQHSLQQPPLQEHQHFSSPATSNHSSFSGGRSSSDSFMVDSHQHHVNGKYNPSLYLQRISGIFANKSSNSSSSSNNSKLQNHHHQQQHRQQYHQQHSHAMSVNPNTETVVVVVGGMGDTDNKHLKLSSSETSSSSSTSLSSCSAVEEVLSGCTSSGNAGHRDVVVDLNCVVDVVGSTNNPISNNSNNNSSIIICTTTDKNVNAKGANGSSGAGGNFLLPRAMLKYQSTAIVVAVATATTAPSITTANKNSMPLATAVTTATNNTTTTSQQQQQPQTTRDVNKTDGVGKGRATLESTKATGLSSTKNSSTSSITTSLNSEDLTITQQGNEEKKVQENECKDTRKVISKAIKPKPSARASSHQSHYSTDKSASSGYYSSNVCSTYSLEEHIYSEPTIDIKDVRKHTKESSGKPLLTTSSSSSNMPQTSTLKPALIPSTSEETSVMRSLDYSRRYRFAENDTGVSCNKNNHIQALPAKRNAQEFNENLKILESSIENLDRHLKSFPGTITQDAIVAYVQNPYSSYATVNHNDKMRSCSYSHLPTIQEDLEKAKQQPWMEEKSDDSLIDIDLDSFLLEKDKKLSKPPKGGLENPSFLTDEQEENHYKCAKYINSCPEDAYRVESDILAPTRSSISEQSLAVSGELYPKRYEEQIHFQNTRELLEDVRDKIRLLTQTQEALELPSNRPLNTDPSTKDLIPKELNSMISTLKQELELYLERMHQHSELEIRQLCTGLVKNQHIVKMKNAFERRKSLSGSNDICSTYEAVQDGIIMNARGVPISIRQQITSIKCSSDPNFKMKRKSITEVFPMAACYIETIPSDPNVNAHNSLAPLSNAHHSSQLHRNLNYHKPVLEQLTQQICHKSESLSLKLQTNSSSSATSGGDTSETNDKESILDWHRKKPSIWEMYYGTNRIQQSLLGGKKNGTMVTTATASSPSTMCYPSSRPESDFTLDLPRAEQLRIKMEKEKKFRQRCRVITTFLSLVFFLLTVMVVSLVLTRGKRMFGSMI